MPTTVTLPSGRSAAVDRADVDETGRLEVPTDPARVGWWTGGAQVDDPFGSVVLAGHVDSADQGLGVLAELLSTEVGEVVVVADASGSRAYTVTSVTRVEKARLGTDTDAFRQDVPSRLVLITCVGPYDRELGAYEENLVVVAEPVGLP